MVVALGALDRHPEERLAHHLRLLGGIVVEEIEARRAVLDRPAAGGDDLPGDLVPRRVGGDLRIEVAVAEMRCSRVQQKHFPHVPPPLARLDELDGREADTLLIDARRIAGLAAGNPAADIGMMRHRRRETDHSTVEENRCTNGAIIEVRDAGDVGIIGEEHIT